MEWIIILLLIWFGFGTVEPVSTPLPPMMPTAVPPIDATPTGGEDVPTFRSLNVIETVEAQILESMPMQITLQVTGYIPDGCEYPVQVVQRREGNTVYVEIFRDVPLAATCLAVQPDYAAEILLEGTFEPGLYTIDVNGTRIEVQR